MTSLQLPPSETALPPSTFRLQPSETRRRRQFFAPPVAGFRPSTFDFRPSPFWSCAVRSAWFPIENLKSKIKNPVPQPSDLPSIRQFFSHCRQFSAPSVRMRSTLDVRPSTPLGVNFQPLPSTAVTSMLFRGPPGAAFALFPTINHSPSTGTRPSTLDFRLPPADVSASVR